MTTGEGQLKQRFQGWYVQRPAGGGESRENSPGKAQIPRGKSECDHPNQTMLASLIFPSEQRRQNIT